ncbi:hypothetical protein C5470_03160 [Photorhabdus stackebrandtii]|uniref:Transposase n=1 Tax=Photorhabdus stackebrandtii TaxID=1123042 RepID=A0A7X5QJI1_9GAMM|nr:hypothetical protein [Photorhabdus stackebrandtii]
MLIKCKTQHIIMIKPNRNQVLKVVKTIGNTLLYRLKPEVQKMAFTNNLKPAHHKIISEKREK